MFAISDDAGNWWYSECVDATEPEGSGQQAAAAPQEASEESVLVLSSLIPSFVPDVIPKEMSPTPKLDVCAHPDRTWEIEELYDSNWNAREFVWSTFSGMDQETGDVLPVDLALRQEGIQSESCRWQRYFQLEKIVLRAPSEGSCVSGQEGIHSESCRRQRYTQVEKTDLKAVSSEKSLACGVFSEETKEFTKQLGTHSECCMWQRYIQVRKAVSETDPGEGSVVNSRDLASDTDDSDMLSVLLPINPCAIDSGFWLLDSGASVNVITPEALKHFQHTEVQTFLQTQCRPLMVVTLLWRVSVRFFWKSKLSTPKGLRELE
eukprot:s4185_g2.t1